MQVVPFSPFAGLLEWVEDTSPLGDYLMGANRRTGAHAKYRPQDWPFVVCFKKVHNAKMGETRLAAYKEVTPRTRDNP